MTAENGFVLAFDTATEACAIGIALREGSSVTLVAARDFEAPRAAMSGLLPAVAGLLEEAGVALGSLTQVVVGRGPGSFTGVRIGVATAKGLAHGLGVPLFGVGTLDAVAWRVPEGYTGKLGVVGDAMRGEVYPALFDITPAEERVRVRRRAEDYVARPADAARAWAALGERIRLTGNGLTKYRDVFADALGERASFAPGEAWAPTGSGLLRAFEDSLRRDAVAGGEPGVLLPVYTRLSDAEEAERARAGLPVVTPPRSGVGGPADAAGAPGAVEPPLGSGELA